MSLTKLTVCSDGKGRRVHNLVPQLSPIWSLSTDNSYSLTKWIGILVGMVPLLLIPLVRENLISLQVLSYGAGGFYLPHTDWANETVINN